MFPVALHRFDEVLIRRQEYDGRIGRPVRQCRCEFLAKRGDGVVLDSNGIDVIAIGKGAYRNKSDFLLSLKKRNHVREQVALEIVERQ
ncbi:hypothetical protein D3C84_994270 [compost metagenome]